MATSWLVYPTDVNTSVAFGAARIVNFPSAFVEVPLEDPFTFTLTPCNGVLLSPVTVPDTEVSCAETLAEMKVIRRQLVSVLHESRKLCLMEFLIVYSFFS
jgi:hypothetical protein